MQYFDLNQQDDGKSKYMLKAVLNNGEAFYFNSNDAQVLSDVLNVIYRGSKNWLSGELDGHQFGIRVSSIVSVEYTFDSRN